MNVDDKRAPYHTGDDGTQYVEVIGTEMQKISALEKREERF